MPDINNQDNAVLNSIESNIDVDAPDENTAESHFVSALKVDESEESEENCFVIDVEDVEPFNAEECEDNTPKDSYETVSPVMEDILTDSATAIDKTIEDVMVLMFETFDKDPEAEPRKSELLPTSADVETRLAELGFDRNFFLYKDKDSVEYRSNEFDITCKLDDGLR